MDSRKIKGRAIAETATLRHKRDNWIVPSQHSEYPYDVSLEAGAKTCSCADFELTGRKCKHIYAAELRDQGRKSFPAPNLEEQARPTYPQNWRAYNAAQTNEKDYVVSLLGSLCKGIAEAPQKMGRPRMPLSDMIFSMAMKVYGSHSGRRTSCDMKDYEDKSLLEAAPHYNTISKYFEKAELTPILYALIEESAAPLKDIEVDFAADSSGFALTNMSNWNHEKWGKYGKQSKRHDWLKLHAMIGVKTNVITSARVTNEYDHDTTQFKGLLDSTSQRFNMKEVSADKAYLSSGNLEAVVAHGAAPYIPFKSNTTGKGSELWRKCYHYFQYRRPDFLAHYHKRSNVESTFSMIKAKFGEKIRAKTRIAQENELLCKALCHNLAVLVSAIFELGVQIEFWR